MRKLREKQVEQGLRPWRERAGLRMWRWAAERPAAYSALTKIAVRILRWMGGGGKLLHHIPFADGWTAGRDMPAPQGKTFRELYARQKH